MKRLVSPLAIVATFTLAAPSLAQVVAPSFFGSSIQVQGEAAGTEFDDWASVPVAVTDSADNPGEASGRPFMDFASLQVANDDESLYLHMAYHNTSSVNTFIGIDLDQDNATGFDLFGLGLIGSDVGYQNDFPFQQFQGVYNINVALTGGPLTNGGALIYTFWDQDGMDKEWAIPLDLMLGFAVGTPASKTAFRTPTQTIDILFYTEEGAGDIIDVVTYTLATPPAGLPGDANGDGSVDLLDLDILGANFGTTTGATIAQGDFNADAAVDLLDLDILGANFGSMAPSAVGVPEPAAALSVTAGALAMLLRRSRA